MEINNLKVKADTYDKSNWSFSSALIWQKIVEMSSTTWNLLQYADQLRLSGKFEKAEKILKNININDLPADLKFVYHVRLGMIFQDQNLIKKAIVEFKKSIKIGTEETYPYIFLAVLLTKQNKLKEAERILLKALNKKGDIDEVVTTQVIKKDQK
jgi:tetratricopeptide (TPR) repeat protein